MTNQLDPITRKVYDFIAAYIKQERRSPALRDIARGCGIAHSSVTTHLARLEGKGWIEREFSLARSIRLGEFAPDYVPDDDAE